MLVEKKRQKFVSVLDNMVTTELISFPVSSGFSLFLFCFLNVFTVKNNSEASLLRNNESVFSILLISKKVSRCCISSTDFLNK